MTLDRTDDGLFARKLGLIKSTSLGFLSHGILQYYLDLDYGGMGQGAGGYCLSHNSRGSEEICYLSLAWIGEVLRTVFGNTHDDHNQTWEKLPGNYVYALFSPETHSLLGEKMLGLEGLPQRGSRRMLFPTLTASERHFCPHGTDDEERGR